MKPGVDRFPNVAWAVAPLRDPANIGRKVWLSWNMNTPTTVLITEVTRVGVRVNAQEQPKHGFKISTTSTGLAHRSVGRWSSTVFTEQHRLETEERADIIEKVRQSSMWHLPIEALREIQTIIEREG